MINSIKLDGHILVGKESLPNRKFTSQKEVNKKKVIQPILTYIATPSQNPIHLKFYPNIEKYIWNLQVKFQLNPTV
jgi:deoxyadenosine/deoxycytidine kinase